MKILGIDASVAGASGDMLIAALLGLYDESDKTIEFLISEINKLLSINISYTEIMEGGFKGIRLKLKGEKEKIETENIYSLIQELSTKLGMDKYYNELALQTFDTILDAEKSIHNNDNIHLHELATKDTVIDIVGVFYLLEHLDIKYINLTPIATGYGSVKTMHGILPVPSPATLNILERYSLPTNKGPLGEACTPTGAAILGILSTLQSKEYNVIWNKSSLGFGNKKFEDRGNFIRVRIGKHSSLHSNISLLETNIDDQNGEILGYLMEKLLKNGAFDVSYTPIFMKKNRPAYNIRIICSNQLVDELAELIQQETGTLGIRIQNIDRHIGKREIVNKTGIIRDKKVEFSVKVGRYFNKIEYDDLKRIAVEYNLPLLKVKQILEEQI